MSFRVKWVLMISFHTEPKWVPHLTYLKHTEKLYTRSEIRNCQLRRTTCIDIPLSTKVALFFKGLWVVDVHSLHQFRSWPFLKRGLTLSCTLLLLPTNHANLIVEKSQRRRGAGTLSFFGLFSCSLVRILLFWVFEQPFVPIMQQRKGGGDLAGEYEKALFFAYLLTNNQEKQWQVRLAFFDLFYFAASFFTCKPLAPQRSK